MIRRSFILLIVMALPLFSGSSDAARRALQKKDVTILITDSGLGGLSVAADLEQVLRMSQQFRSATIVFGNALPGGTGYNDMPNDEAKAKVFSEALTGMVQKYHPDVILIACNTLSVVYGRTAFSKTTTIPVVGIVELAVAMLTDSLKRDDHSVALLFGTETTIGSRAHHDQLVKAGIPESRIITQACPKLESEIQTDPSSDMVRTYIDWYVGEAAGALPSGRSTVYAGMVCTHYGYSAGIFTEALTKAGVEKPVIVNPNSAMPGSVLPKKMETFPNASVTVSVVSRAPISEEERTSIAALLRTTSPKTASALEQYRLMPDLFRMPQ